MRWRRRPWRFPPADALASPTLPPFNKLRGFKQKKEYKSAGADISISTELAVESSKGAYDVLGEKYWACSNKRSRINLVACFGQNQVQQRATDTDHSESHPGAIAQRNSLLGSAVNRRARDSGHENGIFFKVFQDHGPCKLVFLQKQLVIGRN